MDDGFRTELISQVAIGILPSSLFAHAFPRWRVPAFAGRLFACSSDERSALTKPGERAAGGDSGDDQMDLAERILESVKDALIFADRSGMIRRWNSASAALFGFSAEEALGQHGNWGKLVWNAAIEATRNPPL